MIYDRSTITELERLTGIRSLVETYKTIASSSMRRIRNSVLQNREFHTGLNRIYQEVKLAYRQEISQTKRSTPLFKKNRRTAYVLLSANTGLYGEIIMKTFEAFFNEVEKEKCDVVIIGRIGKAVFEQRMAGHLFAYFDMPDLKTDIENIKKITEELHRYEKVVVFHGSFKNFVVQTPVATRLSAEEVELEYDIGAGIRYLFEPSLETIALFFESEIFASLIEQSFHESRLAKLASRLMLLDRSTENIDSEVRKVETTRHRLEHRAFNRKQLDLLSGISLWSSRRAL